MHRTRIVVFGGANTDIAGASDAALVQRDSNPGRVSVSCGGVGRNVAENLARLGCDTALVTAFGGDHNARELRACCEASGIEVSASITCDDLPGSVYLAILDEAGDMALALSDMRALDRLTPEALGAGASEMLASAALVVCDANLPAASLAWVVEASTAPIVLDAVSTAKAHRVIPLLPRLAAVKCNAAEAAVLLGRSQTTAAAMVPEGVAPEASPQELARGLVDAGVAIAVVTAGPGGSAVAWPGGQSHISAPRARVANATGAGDAFTAGFAAMLAEGGDAVAAARLGSALAALTLESPTTVSPRVSREAARAVMEEDGWQ